MWIDLRKYLNPVSFEEEKRLANKLMNNGAYINAGGVFSCAEPGWYRIIFASDPAMMEIGESLTLLLNEILSHNFLIALKER